MPVHDVRIDRSKSLLEQPGTGHNRWHPDIAPIVRCEPGDEVVLQTRDALDGQVGPDTTVEGVGAVNLDVVHTTVVGPSPSHDGVSNRPSDCRPGPTGFAR